MSLIALCSQSCCSCLGLGVRVLLQLACRHCEAHSAASCCFAGSYHGSPNTARGWDDPRQFVWYDPQDSRYIPGVFSGSIFGPSSSTNGMDEYRAQTFSSAWKNRLIMVHLNSGLYVVKLAGSRTTSEVVSDHNSAFTAVSTVPA
jgi:hypothetical protein